MLYRCISKRCRFALAAASALRRSSGARWRRWRQSLAQSIRTFRSSGPRGYAKAGSTPGGNCHSTRSMALGRAMADAHVGCRHTDGPCGAPTVTMPTGRSKSCGRWARLSRMRYGCVLSRLTLRSPLFNVHHAETEALLSGSKLRALFE
jgi:hypothetical protein